MKEQTEKKEFYFREGCFITELYNTTHDPACSVAQARVLPGTTTRWHSLDGIIERYLILAVCTPRFAEDKYTDLEQ